MKVFLRYLYNEGHNLDKFIKTHKNIYARSKLKMK